PGVQATQSQGADAVRPRLGVPGTDGHVRPQRYDLDHHPMDDGESERGRLPEGTVRSLGDAYQHQLPGTALAARFLYRPGFLPGHLAQVQPGVPAELRCELSGGELGSRHAVAEG